jgi:hypothetical protein
LGRGDLSLGRGEGVKYTHAVGERLQILLERGWWETKSTIDSLIEKIDYYKFFYFCLLNNDISTGEGIYADK